MSNKVNFGLKNAHYAVITETAGVITYGTPQRMPGAVSLTLEPKGETSDFFADDIIYYTTSANQGYETTLEVASVTEEFRTEVLGEVMNTTDKVIIEKASAKPKQIAFLFEIDGDVKATRFLLTYCTVTRPGLSGSTKTESTEPGSSELNLVAAPRPTDEIVKMFTSTSTPEAVYNSWFTEVYENEEE